MSYELAVEHGKIREFAKAAQSENAAYSGPNAVIPATFLATFLHWEPPGQQLEADVGFDVARTLHGEQDYVFHGPLPRAGQVLTVESNVTDRFEKQGKRGGTMRFAVITTEFRNREGGLVAEQRSVTIETARPPGEHR